MKPKYHLFLLLGFTAALVFIIVLRNNNLGNSFFRLFISIPYYDKLGHFLLMGILAFLSVITFVPLMSGNIFKSTSIVLGIVLALTALEEYSQIFIPSRSFSLEDFISGLLGVLCFGLLGYTLVAKK